MSSSVKRTLHLWVTSRLEIENLENLGNWGYLGVNLVKRMIPGKIALVEFRTRLVFQWHLYGRLKTLDAIYLPSVSIKQSIKTRDVKQSLKLQIQHSNSFSDYLIFVVNNALYKCIFIQ